tara:strand:+ start:10043 stop:10411 length:369 start_codon:yes stop_codon:yes gene_type:complete
MILQIQLNFTSINVSAQVGDIVFFTPPGNNGQLLGGFDNADVATTSMLGPIISVSEGFITVEYNNTIITTLPSQGAFISFVKDKRVNTSSLLGYYASVNFVNDSTGKVELFSVGSDISESSK